MLPVRATQPVAPFLRPLIDAEGEPSVPMPQLFGDVDRIVPESGPHARVCATQRVRGHLPDGVDPLLTIDLAEYDFLLGTEDWKRRVRSMHGLTPTARWGS